MPTQLEKRVCLCGCGRSWKCLSTSPGEWYSEGCAYHASESKDIELAMKAKAYISSIHKKPGRPRSIKFKAEYSPEMDGVLN